MRFTTSTIIVLFFSLVQLISAESFMRRTSHEKRSPNALQRRHTTHLAKRFSGSFTYYAVGLGSCGTTNVPSDFIVALNIGQYSSSYCGVSITITCNGKTAQATIMDECPGCGYGGLDLSEGLFQYFGSLDAGVLSGSWDFGSSGDSQSTSTTPTPTSTPPAPTTTSTWTPTSTPSPTTSSTPTTTSTPPTTTSSPPPTTSSVPSSSPATPTTSSTSSVPSTSPTPNDSSDALQAMYNAVTGLGNFAQQAFA
ncbi:RlpA-like double-psi beta-barrel-protein domain-containing protein-containing protein [Lactarius tabidus]